VLAKGADAVFLGGGLEGLDGPLGGDGADAHVGYWSGGCGGSQLKKKVRRARGRD
jgi:hypothetical protein